MKVLQHCDAVQCAGAVHPQVRLTQVLLLACPEQAEQFPPIAPHAPGLVPGWQALPSQHPPLHARFDPPPTGAQLVEQRPLRQALSDEQCVDAVVQPQRFAPIACAGVVQALLSVSAWQLKQLPPVVPHWSLAVPDKQSIPLQQPLQSRPAPQSASQVCVVVSHACPAGQSAATSHPHCPVPRQTGRFGSLQSGELTQPQSRTPAPTLTHSSPALLPAQLLHSAPADPQAAAPVPPTQWSVRSQHPPLHTSPPAQELEH